MPIPAWKPSKKRSQKWTLFFDFPGFAGINCGMNCGTSRKGVPILQDLQKDSCIFPSIYEKNQSFLTGLVVEHTGFEPVTSTMRMGVLIVRKDVISAAQKIPSLHVRMRGNAFRNCLT